MVIGVKYCGGCNPRYDRTALISKLKREFPHITVTGADSADFLPDLVAVICGCTNQCAAHGHLKGRLGKLVLYDEDQYEKLRDMVSQSKE